MMHWPVPSAREVRWSFYVAAACVLMIAAAVSWGIIHKIQQSDDLLRIAASSSAQVDRLSEQIDQQAKASGAERDQLREQNRRVHDELRALLRYLRAHDIEIPRAALTPSGVDRPKAEGPRGPRPAQPSSSTSPTPGSPASTAPPGPTASPTPFTDPACGLLSVLCP